MSIRVLRNTLRRSISGKGSAIESRKRAALLGAVAALGFLLFPLSPVSAQVVLFKEDFEGFALGSNIVGQAGWLGIGNPACTHTILVGTGNLPTQLAQGHLSGIPNGSLNCATHAVSGIGTTGVTTLTYDSYAYPGIYSSGGVQYGESHDSGVFFGIGGNSFAAGWFMVHAPWRSDEYRGPAWVFDVRGLTGNSGALQLIPGEFGEPVSLTVVLDPLNQEVFGIINGIETTHVSATAAQIAAVDGVTIFQDQRFGSGGAEFDNILVTGMPYVRPVALDIKPGGYPNSINPRSNGVIPVAILTADTFDATAVDPTTVLFGPTGTETAPVHAALEDVDGDGDTDMILHFNTQATGIQCGDTSASLTGQTLGGQAIQGSDSVNTVGCK